MERRPLGTTKLQVSVLAFGAWPIAGITSIDVSEEQSRATIAAAFESGITFFDTAYAYGYAGESERMIGQVLGNHREAIVLATKGGIAWKDRERVIDARPATLRAQSEESLRRLGFDYVDLLYLHAPDPNTPIEESADALRTLMEEGKATGIGLSNASTEQLEAFAAVCPLTAYQPHYNMLQREIEADVLPWCQARNVSVCVYWPLMKGLLAGKIARDHVFPENDSRRKYPMFQGDEFQRNQDFVDVLRDIAAERDKTVAQVVLNWTAFRSGITSVLCGAKRPEQIRENAGGVGWRLDDAALERIDAALRERGQVASRLPV